MGVYDGTQLITLQLRLKKGEFLSVPVSRLYKCSDCMHIPSLASPQSAQSDGLICSNYNCGKCVKEVHSCQNIDRAKGIEMKCFQVWVECGRDGGVEKIKAGMCRRRE